LPSCPCHTPRRSHPFGSSKCAWLSETPPCPDRLSISLDAVDGSTRRVADRSGGTDCAAPEPPSRYDLLPGAAELALSQLLFRLPVLGVGCVTGAPPDAHDSPLCCDSQAISKHCRTGLRILESRLDSGRILVEMGSEDILLAATNRPTGSNRQRRMALRR
jgi:hypothetical protein